MRLASVTARLREGTKAYYLRLNAALFALGFLPSASDTWSEENDKALEDFYGKFGRNVFQSDSGALAEALASTRRVCNGTTSTLFFGIAEPNAGETAPAAPGASSTASVSGPWSLAPGRCSFVLRSALPNEPLKKLWLRVTDGRSDWKGMHQLCIPTASVIRFSTASGKCPAGQASKPFFDYPDGARDLRLEYPR
jgi:hypothetical protein